MIQRQCGCWASRAVTYSRRRPRQPPWQAWLLQRLWTQVAAAATPVTLLSSNLQLWCSQLAVLQMMQNPSKVQMRQMNRSHHHPGRQTVQNQVRHCHGCTSHLRGLQYLPLCQRAAVC
jgi:hypothetical protein